MLEGSGALALRQFGYEQAEVLSYQFCRAVAKHLLGRRVDCLDAAAAGLQGDDAVHHGLENRLDQRRAVAQGLLRSILLGDITEYQHGTEDLAVPVADRVRNCRRLPARYRRALSVRCGWPGPVWCHAPGFP
jgi:hypothetical protein